MTNRQDSAASSTSGNEPDFAAFGFDGRDDTARFFNHGTQDGNCRALDWNPSIIERWVHCDLDIVLRVYARQNPHVWDFIFRCIKDERVDEISVKKGMFAHDERSGQERNQRMFAQITHVIENVEQTIPALVWLEGAQKRLDFRRAILGQSFYALPKFDRIARERKNSELQVGILGVKESARPSGMVEASPGMLYDLGGRDAPAEREWLSEADFVNFVGAIGTRLNNSSGWLFTEKTINLGFQVVETFLCPREAEIGTVEAVRSQGCHDNNSPRIVLDREPE